MNMKDMKPVKVGVIGCGRISDIYFENLTKRFWITQITKCCSLHGGSAKKQAEKYGCEACSYEEMLADPEIEIILNLTPAMQHKEIIKKAFAAGKHVYTEKVITPLVEDTEELVALAKEKRLYFCTAPEHFMGSSWQCARELIDKGMIGTPTSVYATMAHTIGNFADIFDFINQPAGGAGFDYGIYLLTAMVSLLGPVKNVCGMLRTVNPGRVHRQFGHPGFGEEYTYQNEDMMIGCLEFESGVMGTIHMNGNTIMPIPPAFMIMGTEGAVTLPNPGTFSGEVKLYRPGNPVPTEINPAHGFPHDSRGVGVAEMAWAIRTGRAARAGAERGLHCLEVLTGLSESSKTGKYYTLKTSCERPAALPAGYIGIPLITRAEEGAIVY